MIPTFDPHWIKQLIDEGQFRVGDIWCRPWFVNFTGEACSCLALRSHKSTSLVILHCTRSYPEFFGSKFSQNNHPLTILKAHPTQTPERLGVALKNMLLMWPLINTRLEENLGCTHFDAEVVEP